MNAPRQNGRQLGSGQLLMTVGLLVLVVICALAVVDSTHRSRERFNHLQVLQRQEWALDEEWERLLLEQSTWAAHERVNQIAETRLDMVMPDPAAIRVIPAASSGGGR
jgi:cell division protein FtsL